MIISKKQSDPNHCRLHWSYFKSARAGFQKILERPDVRGKKLFIPAYIGFSVREGSGVFDPIKKTNMVYEFYRMNHRLNIQSAELIKQLKANPGNALLLIHYFGFKDKNLNVIKEAARKHKFVIIEDFAHAYFTFWQNPAVDFDYAFFSIHKMFPWKDGGMVLSRKKMPGAIKDRYALFEFNAGLICQKRMNNASFLLDLLRAKSTMYNFDILKSKMTNVVPQTIPILLRDDKLRDYLYFQLNKQGYGAVSLYHELIPQIDKRFEVEHKLSQRILNLPVHQDTEPSQLKRMSEVLFKLMRSYKG